MFLLEMGAHPERSRWKVEDRYRITEEQLKITKEALSIRNRSMKAGTGSRENWTRRSLLRAIRRGRMH